MGAGDPSGGWLVTVVEAAPDGERVMAQAGAENFPVASRLLPARERGHLLALYGFARLVDDAGDEAAGDRLALLDALQADLDRLWAADAPPPSNALLARLGPTVAACGLQPGPFHRLIDANRQDQRVARYARFADLLAYCDLSANPVGELVLAVFGAATPERVALSDAVCSGLQVVEHLQDVAEDLAAGRIYLPQEDMARFGVGEEDLRAPRASAAVRRLVAFEAARARQLLDRGAPLVRTLRGRPAFAVAAFVAGGRSALAALDRAGYDVLGAAPRPGKGRRAAALLATLRGGEAR